ncbi:hypothetical protein KC614_04260, partial [candidate division WWE3 bacterium]|nr:hypothetical protein [candidate division WWE3 bacterium]
MIELLFDFLKVLLLILVIVLTTIASYATSSLSYAVIGRHFDKEMAIEKLMKVGFVGAVFDRVLSIGGIPGLSIRLILNSKFGIRVAKSWRMIALQFYSYRVLSLLLLLYVMSLAPAKLSELYDVNGLEKSSYIGLIFVALLVLAAFIKPLRERFNALVSSMRDRLTKRLKIDFETSELEENVSFSFGKVAPREYAIFAASVIGDWVFITMCLYAIFLLL